MHLDMDGDGMHDEATDYSSFDYQWLKHNHSESGNNSANSTIYSGVDPLDDRGGLDVNEVAELVAYRIEARFGGDGYEPTGDTRQGSAEFRGAFGINLSQTTEELVSSGTPAEDGAVIEETDGANVTTAEVHSKSDAGTLDSFDIDMATSFADATNGLGGAGGMTRYTDTVNYRDMTGRGPVVDSEDELTFVTRIIKNQVDNNVEAGVRVGLIWDTAEVGDAGRRFSVPQ